uniref:hypothetical protein n=1 Tax=Candidatus Cardinium sp. cBcalN1 TaxID=2699437 RepID=UPI001FB52713
MVNTSFLLGALLVSVQVSGKKAFLSYFFLDKKVGKKSSADEKSYGKLSLQLEKQEPFCNASRQLFFFS